MKALCWQGKNKVEVERVNDPEILNPRDGIVRITRTAICGSDLHLYDGYIPTMEAGDVLGHEFMGEIVETGSEVKRVKKGDRVVIPFTIACGQCGFCKQNLWSACDNTNPNAWMMEKIVWLLRLRLVWLFPHDGRVRGWPGAIRARALYRRGRIANSRWHRRREGAFPFRYFPHRIYGGGKLQHQARRRGCDLGMRSGRPVRYSQRIFTRGRACDCD